MFTFFILAVFRFVAHVPIPGVDAGALSDAFKGNAILSYMNLFSGGALRKLSVAAMGVYPYITSTIVMQLLIPVVPSLQALSKEGEAGRNKITLYTYWLAVPLAVVQGYSAALHPRSGTGAISNIGFTGSDALPTFAAVASMTAGTMFLVWLGELITENGIGNGISLIIFGGIVAGMPTLLPSISQLIDRDWPASGCCSSSSSCSWRSSSSSTRHSDAFPSSTPAASSAADGCTGSPARRTYRCA